MSEAMQALLEARETRWLRRKDLSRRGALLTLTMNVPGADKNPLRWNEAHRKVTAELQIILQKGLLRLERQETPAGAESNFVTELSGRELKKIAVRLEEEHPIGRLLDADVMEIGGEPIGREDLALPPRRCLCCDRQAKMCARGRRHSLEELFGAAEALLDSWRGLC